MRKAKKNNHTRFFCICGFIMWVGILCCLNYAEDKQVPEISRALYDQDVLDLTGKDVGNTIFTYQGELVFVAADGKISRWNPEEKLVDDLYNLNKKVDFTIAPLQSGKFLVIKVWLSAKGTTGYVVFDLQQMKETTLIKDMEAQKLLAVNDDKIVYTTPGGETIFYNYHKGTRLHTLTPTASNDKNQPTNQTDAVLGCECNADEIILLTKQNLYLYSQATQKMAPYTLKYPAISGFLKVGKYLYYGSQSHELIKLAYQTNKVDWHFLLANSLLLTPRLLGPYLVVTPEDQNIYFFNENGTLYWWEQLNSSQRLPLLTMKENAVTFLMDNRIKFFNYKKKQVITYPLPTWMSVKSNPINLGEYIYVVTQDKVEEKMDTNEDEKDNKVLVYKRLSKIGNNYTVEILMEPENIFQKGKSIKVDINNINFIDPQYTIQIVNFTESQKNPGKVQKPVFQRIFGVKDKPTFVWIPEAAAEYRMLIQVDAKNKKGLIIEKAIQTIDITKSLQDFYYQLQREYTTPNKNSHETK